MANDTTPARNSIWQAIETELEALKAPINAEIRAYPLPIPGCDAQYNHLLEQRSAIAGDLRRIREARDGGLAAQQLLDSLAVLDDARKEAIRRSLGD